MQATLHAARYQKGEAHRRERLEERITQFIFCVEHIFGQCLHSSIRSHFKTRVSKASSSHWVQACLRLALTSVELQNNVLFSASVVLGPNDFTAPYTRSINVMANVKFAGYARDASGTHLRCFSIQLLELHQAESS